MDGISILSSNFTSVIYSDNYLYCLARINNDIKYFNDFDCGTRKAAH